MMKTTLPILITLAAALGAAGVWAQDTAPASPAPATEPATAPSKTDQRKAQRKAERKAAKNAPAPATAAQPAEVAKPAEPEPQLRLNFRGVPLEMVLNYLSEAAGFTILLETPVKGTVDVWSNQPLTKAEAVELLNSVLNKNGYAAIQNGRMLTIVAKEEARKRNVPVKTGADPLGIPKNDEIVTQIIPVRYISAAQLIRELAQLLPATAVITANEAGNSLVMTDTQANIRRVTEIVSALDTAQSGVSGIRVFALKFADAKALATTIRDLFQDTGRSSNNDPRAAIASFISSRTGGPGGGPPGFSSRGGDSGRGSSGGGGGSRGPAASARVTAVADEHSNSLIVSASEDAMPTIEQVINAVDTDVQDLTELRVFTLKYSDPTEMAELLNNLFAESSSSDQSRGGGFRFGGGFPGFPGGGPPGSGGSSGSRSGGTSESERKKLQGSVTAVADPRTSSVVVSAAKEMMPQIAEMVLQLDSNPARKQKVFVYSLDNANVTEVESVLRNLFESQNSRGTSTQNQQNNALQNRQNTTSQQQQQGLTSGFGQGGGQGGGNR
jgi:general secretion pathway protein D